MMQAIKKLFGLSEAQEKTLALVENALRNKNYKVGRNEFFYDEGRHHSLSVQIFLAPELAIEVHTLFATTDFLAFNPQEREPKGAWSPEISSRKAYFMVLNHFKQILLDAEQAEKQAYENRQKRFADIAKKSF